MFAFSLLIGSLIEHTRRWKANLDGKNRGEERLLRGENRKNIYYDWQGNERDLSTSKKVMFWFNSDHHYVEMDLKGNVIRDLTQEEIDNSIEYYSQIPNGKAVVEQYNYHQLIKMWNNKFNKNQLSYLHRPLPELPYLMESIYIHCKTKKLCYRNSLNGNAEYKEKAKEFFGCGWIQLISGFYIDIVTGEILDIDKEFLKNSLSYEENSKEERPLTEEENRKLIDFFNQEIKNHNLKPMTNPWKELFI